MATSKSTPSANPATSYTPFMTSRDVGRLMPGDDGVPGMLINPSATPGALFAIATSRLDAVEGMLDALAGHDSPIANFADTLRPYLEEVLTLLEEGNRLLCVEREAPNV